MNILIVDDNAMYRTLAQRSLGQMDYSVRGIDPASAFEVLRVCMDFKPNLVILDFHLPRCNAETLALILKEDPSFQPLKILCVSSSRDPEVEARMLRAGVDRFSHKGSMASLLEDVRTLLA